MKLIGYREANFRPDNGKGEEIKGYMIYLGNEIDPRRGGGMEAERQYLTQSKIDREGISLPELCGKDVNVYYNRYGKIASIIKIKFCIPTGIRSCGLFRDQRKKARKSPSQEDCGIPQAKRGYAAKVSLLGLWIDFIIYAGTTEPLL